MQIIAEDFMVNLSAADRVRLEHVRSEVGGDDASVLRSLVHDFFARTGVNNLNRRARSKRRFSVAVGCK